MNLVRSLDDGNAWAVGRFDALASQAHLPDARVQPDSRRLPGSRSAATSTAACAASSAPRRATTRRPTISATSCAASWRSPSCRRARKPELAADDAVARAQWAPAKPWRSRSRSRRVVRRDRRRRDQGSSPKRLGLAAASRPLALRTRRNRLDSSGEAFRLAPSDATRLHYSQPTPAIVLPRPHDRSRFFLRHAHERLQATRAARASIAKLTPVGRGSIRAALFDLGHLPGGDSVVGRPRHRRGLPHGRYRDGAGRPRRDRRHPARASPTRASISASRRRSRSRTAASRNAWVLLLQRAARPRPAHRVGRLPRTPRKSK